MLLNSLKSKIIHLIYTGNFQILSREMIRPLATWFPNVRRIDLPFIDELPEPDNASTARALPTPLTLYEILGLFPSLAYVL